MQINAYAAFCQVYSDIYSHVKCVKKRTGYMEFDSSCLHHSNEKVPILRDFFLFLPPITMKKP